MPTSTDVANQALEFIGAQTQITALNDGTPAGNAAGVLYTPAVSLLLRQMDPDFARRIAVALVLQAGASNPTPWKYEYSYPADCLRLRQVRPAAGRYVALDPRPVLANVALDVITGTPTKVILTNEQNALATYTSSDVSENQWDSAFLQAVVRMLANPLSMAIAGRPDFAKELLAESDAFAQRAELVDDSMIRFR